MLSWTFRSDTALSLNQEKGDENAKMHREEKKEIKWEIVKMVNTIFSTGGDFHSNAMCLT